MRVLGLDRIGVLGAAQYATNFFQILIDFGFIYSATAKSPATVRTKTCFLRYSPA